MDLIYKDTFKKKKLSIINRWNNQ